MVGEQFKLLADSRLKNAARYAVKFNARRDTAATRYARVPSGVKTCAFCAMLASRGWVYTSQDAAGAFRKFHAHCDCLIVPAFNGKIPAIKNYDPDQLYREYQAAREAVAKSGEPETMQAVLKEMRSAPGRYKDSYALSKDIKLRAAQRGRLSWAERQSLIGGDVLGEMLQQHEIVFYEQFMDSGEKFTLIAREAAENGKGLKASNDFIWYRKDGDVPTELKSMQSPDGKKAADRIQTSFRTAWENHGVTKDTFIFYSRKYPPKKSLWSVLKNYNEARDMPVKAIYWWDGETLKAIIEK